MKGIIRRTVCGLLLLMSIATMNVSAKTVALVGDANGDGVVDIADGVSIVNYITGKPCSPFHADRADVDGDGVIDIADAVGIINIVIGKAEVRELAIDTLRIEYQEKSIHIDGIYDERRIKTKVQKKTGLKVTSKGKHPFVCMVEGSCPNGSLTIEADTIFTLVLNNLRLTSQQSAAINFTKKQNVEVELAKGSQNVLSDASTRDENDDVNACFYSKGSLTFTGKGSLSVTGNYRHGIASSKNIGVENGRVVIENVVKNGIHCDKFTLKEGQIELHLQNDASKGIKAKEDLKIKGGAIEGEATGGIAIEDGDISYCAFLKSDGGMSISDGSITLTHSGEGGRCISVDDNMEMTGGTLTMECTGDGGNYTNEAGESDYYTPKCITADNTLSVKGGNITCVSTGLGGKGIVAGQYLSIGSETSKENSPTISVETKGECIINSVDEDQRFGCPKGIKCDSVLVIYDGDITVTTAGMGGEGVECNGKMYVKGGSLQCFTFDDGINVGKSIEISGGKVYCNSVDNDGIDSNGSITISGGIVASVNQMKPNESFDAEEGQLFFTGGTVFGIGSGPVNPVKAALPTYSTPYNTSDEGPRSIGLILTDGKYVYVQKGDKVVMALRNDNRAFRSFVTIMSPSFTNGEQFVISEGDCLADPQQTLFGERLIFGCTPVQPFQIVDIQVQIIQ